MMDYNIFKLFDVRETLVFKVFLTEYQRRKSLIQIKI